METRVFDSVADEFTLIKTIVYLLFASILLVITKGSLDIRNQFLTLNKFFMKIFQSSESLSCLSPSYLFHRVMKKQLSQILIRTRTPTCETIN